ncbi:hypothetical protein AHF37_11973, partial [Paragonimus kellicotti]
YCLIITYRKPIQLADFTDWDTTPPAKKVYEINVTCSRRHHLWITWLHVPSVQARPMESPYKHALQLHAALSQRAQPTSSRRRTLTSMRTGG